MTKFIAPAVAVAAAVALTLLGAESASAADAGGRAAVSLGRAYLGRA